MPGLPRELAALPHVESSFDPTAYSKVGAAGLWQFMPGTGRRFLRVNDAVDERLDPYRATEAAAQLLDYNYRLLGNWPLALTAYNHGAKACVAPRLHGHLRHRHHRAQYPSPSFGFASRNFYVSFLAALEIDRNPEKYFGSLSRQPRGAPWKWRCLRMSPVRLQKTLKIERSRPCGTESGAASAGMVGRQRLSQGVSAEIAGRHWTMTTATGRRSGPWRSTWPAAARSYRLKPGDTIEHVAKNTA